jgi:hypothetical protein
MPPGFGQLDIAIHFEINGVPSGFRNSFRAMSFQQLPRKVVDFDFSHGVTLLSFPAITNRAAGSVDVHTCEALAVCILARDVCKGLVRVMGSRSRALGLKKLRLKRKIPPKDI